MEEKETIGAEPQPTPEQWAEKLRQLETQSHDQVRIIEHLEQELAKERGLRTQLVNVLQWFADGYPLDAERISAKELIQKAKEL